MKFAGRAAVTFLERRPCPEMRAARSDWLDLDCPSPGEELDDQHNQRHDQQNVDVPGDDVEANETDKPQNEKNDEKRPQHRELPPFENSYFAVVSCP
jgi:hypothetical protein